MDIKIGKFTLKSDRYCAYIVEDVEAGTGKVRQERVTGYWREIGGLLDDFVDRQVKGSGAESMKQCLAEIETALNTARKLAREAYDVEFKFEEKEKV